MAAKDTRISPVRSKTTVKANQESQEPVRLPSRWHVICRPKIFVPVVWIVATVLLLGAIFLYFITKRWPILEEDEPTQRKRNPQVVVILIPGMRWDALDTWTERELRGFRPFFSHGVRVSQVAPVFPSFSLPSWTTLQTGLYPEEHGILGDAMYDSEAQMDFDEFRDSVKDDRWWQEREPIWITATEAGRRVATLQWNNADVPFYGKLPEVAQGYTASSSSFLERVENVTKLLRQEFNLIMVSYDGLENATLKYGPFSKEVMFYVFI
ncbi:hypothetical protein R5R35_005533 [Gryllus longicercus]|uniref:Ectonucleotide pyrophosphatase/phosphodiesterase n=1 Tax=Gryllus longicercus TaxID=2509291 RepID=A0AAN9Z9N7_9ORTH